MKAATLLILTVLAPGCATLVYPPRGNQPGLVKYPPGGTGAEAAAMDRMSQACPGGYYILSQEEVIEGYVTSTYGNSNTNSSATASGETATTYGNRSAYSTGTATATGASTTTQSGLAVTSPNSLVHVRFSCGRRPAEAFAPRDEAEAAGDVRASTRPTASRLEGTVVAVVAGKAIVIRVGATNRLFAPTDACTLSEQEKVLFIDDQIECDGTSILGLSSGATCELVCQE